MKIVTRKEFMKMPRGTFFAKGERWCFDNLCMKTETWEESNDFLYMDLMTMDAHSGDELHDRMERSLETGISYPLETCESRDGCFNDEDLFLIFEREDLERIVRLIHNGHKEIQEEISSRVFVWLEPPKEEEMEPIKSKEDFLDSLLPKDK
jgi:hypothetical protein